ncbi:MAG: LLM class flavin-dependent oxidoreductase [Rhodocyclaceae bacterium]
MIPFSVLDLSPICADGTARDALANTLDLARHAERLGYHRYWLAEHHNMPGIASAATAVVIGHVAGGTSRIRVGAGGIMLPNHAPLVIAEQFGTLESLYPGRIDLGLGRAPGTDQRTARALRRNLTESADTFPQDVVELLDYFHGEAGGPDDVKAVPGQGLNIPVWLLGSSMFSAQLAAALGLPFAFASHFAPDYLEAALQMYRARFQPSRWLDQPYAMAGLNVFAADTDADARLLFTSIQQQFINLRRGMPGKLSAPSHEAVDRWSPIERAGADHALSLAVVGAADTVEQGIRRFIERTGVDELMVTAQIFDHPARVRSFEIVADVRDRLA